MNKYLRIVVILIVFLSSYHLVRDLLQIIGINNLFTNILHHPHTWCGPYCGIVTLPLDLIEIIGGIIVLKRNKFGSLGIILFSTLPLWLLALLLP